MYLEIKSDSNNTCNLICLVQGIGEIGHKSYKICHINSK